MDAPALQYVSAGDGVSLAYTSCGVGTPLVLMPHPYSHTHHYWRSANGFRSLYEHLAAAFHLTCYDSRGLGSSTRGLSEDFRIEDFQTDLGAVVDGVGLQRFVLMAQAGFCRVAVKYAMENPERVQALVMWNVDTGDPVRDGWAPSQIAPLAETNWDMFIDMMARSSWMWEDAGLARTLLKESITQADWLRRQHAWPHFRMPENLRDLRVPTLLLASGEGASSFSREGASKFVASQIAGARLEILDDPGAGLFTQGPNEPPGVALIREFIAGLPPDSADPPAGGDGLSPRELEVLRLIAVGRSNAQIAVALVISPNTVGRHVSNIFDKTGAANRAEATAYAMRNGLA